MDSRPRPASLRDLTDDLLWPTLLRAPAMALAPSRLALGFLGIVLLGLSLRTPNLWLETDAFSKAATTAWLDAYAAAPEQGPQAALSRPGAILFGGPWRLLSSHPISTLVVALLAAAAVTLAGGAIARSTAIEFTGRGRPPNASTLRFAASRWRSLMLALLAPLAAVAIIRVLIAVLGWAALSLPWLNVLGAILYPIAMLLGLAAVVLLITYALGGLMLTPAIACEGSDAIDAVQRVLAYVVARPLRLIAYLAVLAAVGLLAFAVFRFAAFSSVYLTGESASLWLAERPAALLTGDVPDSLRDAKPHAHEKAAHAILGLWFKAPAILVASWIFALIHTAGTLLYLIVRRVNDGQDTHEIWIEPGQMP